MKTKGIIMNLNIVLRTKLERQGTMANKQRGSSSAKLLVEYYKKKWDLLKRGGR